MHPPPSSEPLLRTAEALLERRSALMRRRRGTPWSGQQVSHRLLETTAESLALLQRAAALRARMQVVAGAFIGPGTSVLDDDPAGEAPDIDHAIEQERQRMARELHDTVGQQLCAMRLTVADARKSRQAGLLSKRLSLLESLITAADLDLDRAVFALHPPALDRQGLAEAVRQHVSHWSALFGVPVDLLISGLDERHPPPAVTAAAYRIVQECFTNIAKHARANRVGVALSVHRGQLHLSIEDDGRGFTPGATPGGRLGLVGMSERVAALQGRFEVESTPDEGTTVLVTLPLRQPQQKDVEPRAAPFGR